MGAPGDPKTVHIFLGFFFVVNFCLGTGFLGVPYTFFYSGYLASIPSLLVISLISWVNANYLLEVMARAQALEYFYLAQKRDILSSEDELALTAQHRTHPTFEITVHRKFEVVELCEIFFNKYVKYIYLVILSVYCFLALWSFSTVAGSAWAINIPYKFGGVERTCVGSDSFQHAVLPDDPSCRDAYYFSLFLFAIIVVSLSLIDLREQAILQMILGLLRFLTVAAIIIYSVVKMIEGDGVCLVPDSQTNGSEDGEYYSNFTSEDIVVKFDPKGWVTAIPVLTYAFILHQGLASLTHPIKQKKYMWYLTAAMFGSALFCYMSLGVIVPLWFRESIQETITLNFSDLTSSDHSIALRLLAYYIILFPSLDVASAYPLMVHTIVNNFYILVMGHDTSKAPPPKHRWLNFFLKTGFRFFAAIVPILAAFGVANLVYVLKYAGLMGFNICFFFPTILQMRSIYVCRSKFQPSYINVSGESRLGKTAEEKQSLLTVQNAGTLFGKQESRSKSELYMTPYSSCIFSSPVAVVIIGVLGVCLFVLTLVSLGVHPDKVNCPS